ncbi:hypothetical protein AGMMS49936_02620 [Endomicrobiia bacterium]|nr:hypothetical protein AGMMS49936_02620 [Endomicrobiia bacterium]
MLKKTAKNAVFFNKIVGSLRPKSSATALFILLGKFDLLNSNVIIFFVLIFSHIGILMEHEMSNI